MPPAIIWQRFCIMAQAVASSQVQVNFIPPVIFSIFIMQRGTITMFGVVVGMVLGAIPVLIPLMVARSIIIVVAIVLTP